MVPTSARLAALAVAVTTAAACGDTVLPGPETVAASDEPTPHGGITDEPCPDAVDEEKGCLYLGVVTDVTEGPFHPFAVEAAVGQEAFWRTVNEAGGIGAYEIDVGAFARDGRADPAKHRRAYEEIEGDVLALGQSVGAEATHGLVSTLELDDLLAVPISWWSGWNDAETDHGRVLESGSSYCSAIGAGLDWFAGEHGVPAAVATVGFDDLYGRDVGVRRTVGRGARGP